MGTDALSAPQQAAIDVIETFGAHNYAPLPVVIDSAEGVHLTDTDGRRYLDCVSAYSAMNFGHRHPALVAAAMDQLGRVTLTSRASTPHRSGRSSSRSPRCAGSRWCCR